MKKIPLAMLAVALIAITVIEGKKAKAVQDRARRALYPGDTQEMADVLAELRSHRDPESQTLASQLEERLKIRGHRQRHLRLFDPKPKWIRNLFPGSSSRRV